MIRDAKLIFKLFHLLISDGNTMQTQHSVIGWLVNKCTTECGRGDSREDDLEGFIQSGGDYSPTHNSVKEQSK